MKHDYTNDEIRDAWKDSVSLCEFLEALPTRSAEPAEIAALKAERDKWEEDALRYCKNAEFWRSESDKAQAELAALRQPIQSDVGISLGQVAFDAWKKRLGYVMEWEDRNQEYQEAKEISAQAVASVVLAQAVRRIEAVPWRELKHVNYEAVRARLIAAVKGEGQVTIKGLEGLTKERCLRIAEIEGDSTIAAGRPDVCPHAAPHVFCETCKASPCPIGIPKKGEEQAMTKNVPGDKCPACGAEEVESNTPNTTYACGSSDYDGRPGTFHPGDKCEAKPVVVNELPQGEKQPDLSGESEKQDLGAMVKAAREAAIKGLTGPAWIPHDGGPCLLKDEGVEEFEFKIRGGGVSGPVHVPNGWRWSNDGTTGDIIAYRVLKWKPGHGPEAKAEPATFQAHGYTWTRHTPGDPMPCDGKEVVQCMFADGDLWPGSFPAKDVRWTKNNDLGDVVGWRYADEPAKPTTSPGWTPTVGQTVRSIPEMALGGQMYWRDLALQIARVWWKCHNLGASLQHGDLDKDIAFSIVCKRHGGRVFHGDTPENAWHKAEEWLLSPDRENFPAACLTPAKP